MEKYITITGFKHYCDAQPFCIGHLVRCEKQPDNPYDGEAICFRYFDYTVAKQQRFRKDGAWYEISPFALMWDNEKYYMLGYDAQAGQLRHYRVDKMESICTLDAPREGGEQFRKLDMAEYAKRVFGMFTGEVQTVRLRFENSLVGAVLDRFGRDAVLAAADEEHFTVAVSVAVSPRFFGWLFGFGPAAEILSPPAVREQFRQRVESVRGLYEI